MVGTTALLVVGVLVFVAAESCRGKVLPADEDIASPLRIAQCRAGCLARFSKGSGEESTCLQGPDCFMCWENCELLQSNFAVWGAMCSEKSICFPGCEEACRFHRESGDGIAQSQPVIHTRGDQVALIRGASVSWPRPPTAPPSTPLVYLVVRRQQTGATWTQVTQTVELSVEIPERVMASSQNSPTVRVLVVSPQGLMTIYSPDEKRSPGIHARLAAQSPVRRRINTELVAPTTQTPWTLRQVSLIHQKVLAIAEVSWPAQYPASVALGSRPAVYLVTWEVDGGGLKGNLFTDSTCVTLSLWPDTVYHIQVELVSSDVSGLRSQSLRIDTHRSAASAASERALEATFAAAAAAGAGAPPHPHNSRSISSPLLSVLVTRRDLTSSEYSARRVELLAGTGAALLLFLAVMGLIIARRRRLHGGSEGRRKLIEDLDTVKGFRPVVTTLVPGTATRAGTGSPSNSAAAANPAASSVMFLQAAQRGASNEVQV